MIKKLTEHSIYEIWNENVSDSVFFQNSFGKKPNQTDLINICIEEMWVVETDDVKQYIKDNIQVFKLRRLYTNYES